MGGLGLDREVARQHERKQSKYDPLAILWDIFIAKSGTPTDFLKQRRFKVSK